MSFFGRLLGLDPSARALEEAARARDVDDQIPIDEPRAPDGEVARAARLLREALEKASAQARPRLQLALAGMLRRLGAAEVAEADALYHSLRAAYPRWSGCHWDHSLLLKKWGRFEDGLSALEAYERAGGDQDQAFRWNTGICATGAGRGEQALAMWRALGFEVGLGGDGLPEGGFPWVQVRIASRGPLCAPTREQREGEPQFEYGWVRPASPCHGVLVTPLFLDEPADVGDTLLWDGAPVRQREFDGRKVSAFPLLAVLRRGGFLRFRFRAEQSDPGLIAALEESLPQGTRVYVHDEQMERLCQTCGTWNPPASHEHERPPTRAFVAGKLAVPPQIDLAELRARLAESLRVRPNLQLAVPALHRHAGDEAAARADDELWERLGAS
jgi:hypothetical protein